MNTNQLISRKINRIANILILAEKPEYVHDPDHKKHPGGGYTKTEKGWTLIKKERPTKENSSKRLETIKALSVREQLSIAENPKTSIEDFLILLGLSTKKNWTPIPNAIAQNKKTPAKVLESLVEANDYEVCTSVAANPNTPQRLLEKLSNDSRAGVREEVAKNPNCSLKTLKRLSDDKRYYTRRGVAANPNTPQRLLEKLSNDGSADVRVEVAKNPNTSLNTLQKLLKDKDGMVVWTVNRKLSATSK